MTTWINNLFRTEPIEEESTWGKQGQARELPRTPPPSVREGPLSSTNQSFIDALSGSVEAPIEKRLALAFKTIYQHLNEEHYIDRLVNALYIKSRKRATGAPSDHIIFENRIRAQFPSPSELGPAIQKARDERLYLIDSLLSSSIARFRLCSLAHLFEAAFALQYDNSVNGVSPRELETEEVDYVLEKIQYIFFDLFKLPNVQTDLRALLSMIYEADEVDGTGTDRLSELLKHVPPIAKQLFPCLEGLTQEFLNLRENGKSDAAFKSEIRMLYRFTMLSLKYQSFVTAGDYITTGRAAIEKLRSSLQMALYKGPAERLMKTVVGLAEQFWDGGMVTEISLAIEQVMTAMIKDAIQHQGPIHQAQADTGDWDVMRDFSRLLALVNVNVPPVPLPSVVVNRKHWVLALDSIILGFPNLLPKNIHLNSTIEYDRATKSAQREWHLKIRGIEIVAKNIAYCLQRRDKTTFHTADIGEANVTIPAKSLDMDLKFTVTTPSAGKPKASAIIGRRSSVASAVPDTPVAQPPVRDRNRGRSRGREAKNDYNNKEDEKRGVIAKASSLARAGRSIEQQLATEARRAVGTACQRLRGQDDDADTHWSPPSQEPIVMGRPRPQYAFSALPTAAERAGNGNGGGVGGQVNGQVDRASAVATTQIVAVEPHKGEETFISMRECKVHLRKVEMNVVSSKHPVIQVFAHPLLARQLRKGIEQALVKITHRVVEVVNESVENIMEREHRLHESLNNHNLHSNPHPQAAIPVKTGSMLAFQTQPVGPYPIPDSPTNVELSTFTAGLWAAEV
ncbi:hypothetical protein BGZ52_011886 [Haplosporangium bisporale]|nr:hypothetical protein BGZ52_011886 [Haplosporangium bisporale]